MNEELLFDSFSYLDEHLIERSEAAVKPRAAWHRWAGMAACLALVAVLGIAARETGVWRQAVEPESGAAQFAPGYEPRPGESDIGVETEDAERKWDAIVESLEPSAMIEAEDAEREWEAGYAPGADESDEWDRIANAPAAMLPDIGEGVPEREINYISMIKCYETDGEACYDAPKNGEAGVSMPLREAMNEYGDGARYRVVVDLFQNERQLPAEGFEARDEIDRLAALGYTSGLESYYDHGVLENAYFTLYASCDQLESFAASDKYGYMFFLYGERVPDYDPDMPVVFSPGSAAVDETPADIVEFTPPEELSVDSGAVTVCPPDRSEAIDYAEALADKRFGYHLPAAGPEGFSESEFRRDENSLRASWRKGYDYLEWQVSYLTDEQRTRIVSVDETEKYDLSLYPIPRADSVPAELRQVVDDPLFRRNELTLDTVYKRAYKVDDAGDTDGWRMEFSVYCPEYDNDIVVRITAKGVSPEWLYEQLHVLP